MKITQNKSGKWIIDFTFKNRRIRRVIGERKQEAEAAAIRIKNDILTEKYGFAKPKRIILFEKFAKEFLELHSKQNKKSWGRDDTSLKHLVSFFKGKALSDITPELIEKYKAKRREQVSSATVNRELACLKTLYSKAVEWDKIQLNPAIKIKKLKENGFKERILTNEEMKNLIEVASPHLKPVLTIALNTGMRRTEILSLKWKDVNFSKGYIFIEDSKSGRSRKIPMNIMTLETLKDIKQASEFVFFNPETKTCIKDVKTAFKTACKKADIKNFRFHDLRHTAATKMIEAGIDLVTVSKILGHSNISMTMRYAHPTPENMQRAVEVLAEAFKKPRHKVDTLENLVEVPKPVNRSILYN